MLLVGTDGVVDCNQAALTLLDVGDKAEIAPDAPWLVLTPARLRKSTIAELTDCARQAMHTQFTLERADRTSLEIDASWSLLPDVDPPLSLAALTVNSENAGDPQAVASEREAARRYRSIVDTSDEIIHCCSLDGRFTYASPSWTQSLGHAPEEVVGRLVSEFVHPDDYPKGRAIALALIENPNLKTTFDCRVRHKAGEWRTLAVSYGMIFDESARPSYLVGVAKDVTEQRRYEVRARRSEGLLSALNQTGAILLGSTSFEAAIGECLRIVGRQANVDSIDFFIKSEDGRGLTSIAEWRREGIPSFAAANGSNFMPWERATPGMHEKLLAGEGFELRLLRSMRPQFGDGRGGLPASRSRASGLLGRRSLGRHLLHGLHLHRWLDGRRPRRDRIARTRRW